MSVVQPGVKRPHSACAVFDEKLEVVPSHTVIVSHCGDLRPDEVVADSLTTCLLNLQKSVTSYVVVPTCGAEALCLANFHDTFTGGRNIGQVKKRYMKKIIPDTAYLKNTQCHVMIFFSHGTPRSEIGARPHYICFRESDSVSVDGQKLEGTPEEAKIWSCSEYTSGEKTYAKKHRGVTLSEVVGQSKLVILLACCSAPIIQEFSAEEGRKPDFVILAVDLITHDIANHVLIALLCTSLENTDKASKKDTWHDDVRTHVCKVLLSIKQHGADEGTFWNFLQTCDVIKKGHVPLSDAYYRIRGHAHSYEAETDDKKIVWEEMNALTLKIWHDGRGAAVRGYVDINTGASEKDLAALIDGSLKFADYKNFARTATLPYALVEGPTASGPSLEALMLQLQALAHGV